ncbi:MAG: stage III sporulation protein AE [Oscillospiraceae bacterium]|nr:stage III sporulation protein AE [Oscillospiraceae bacterium]
MNEFIIDFGADELERNTPVEVLQMLGGVNASNAGDNLERGFFSVFGKATSLFPGSLGEGMRVVMVILVIAALCAVASSLMDGDSLKVAQLAGVLAIAAVAVIGMNSVLAAGREALGQMNVYSKALLPTLAAASAASGKPASAIFRQAGTALASDMLMTMYDRLLYPLLYIYAALVTFSAALPNDMTTRLAGFVKWIVGGLLTISLVLFTAYLTIGGAVSGSADAASIKTAKAALGGAVPVVGGIIADASETLLSGAAVIKNTIGVFGLFAVLGVVIGPIVAIAARVLCFKLGAALAGTLGGEGIAKYIDKLAGLYSMMLGLVSASAFLLIISIVMTVLAGG